VNIAEPGAVMLFLLYRRKKTVYVKLDKTASNHIQNNSNTVLWIVFWSLSIELLVTLIKVGKFENMFNIRGHMF
jgi:hypothetical protein